MSPPPGETMKLDKKPSETKHGGVRPNSGRKPGSSNTKTRETIKAVEESGLTPLEYMLAVMRDAAMEPRERLSAAVSAAPYVHAKLASVEFALSGSVDVVNMTKEQRDAAVAAATRADA